MERIIEREGNFYSTLDPEVYSRIDRGACVRRHPSPNPQTGDLMLLRSGATPDQGDIEDWAYLSTWLMNHICILAFPVPD